MWRCVTASYEYYRCILQLDRPHPSFVVASVMISSVDGGDVLSSSAQSRARSRTRTPAAEDLGTSDDADVRAEKKARTNLKAQVKKLKSVFKDLNMEKVRNYFEEKEKKMLGDSDDDLVDVAAFEVCSGISPQLWEAFAAESDECPRISLRFLDFANNKVYIVEYPHTPPHEIMKTRFVRALHSASADSLDDFGNVTLHGFEADATFGPGDYANRLPRPVGLPANDPWVTIAVEIARTQTWDSLVAKANVWAQIRGIQYIICLKVSEDLNCCRFSLYSIPGNPPLPRALPEPTTSDQFDLRNQADANPYIIQISSRQVLQVDAAHPLPIGVPAVLEISLRDVTTRARAQLFRSLH
jgi:hypothetical protein